MFIVYTYYTLRKAHCKWLNSCLWLPESLTQESLRLPQS